MSTPAGWYLDNQQPGVERWWDGASWTDQSRPVTAAQPAGYPATTGYPGYGGYAAAPRLGNQWLRLVARIIDGLIVGLPALLITYPWLKDYMAVATDFQNNAMSGQNVDPLAIYSDPRTIKYYVITTIVSLIVTSTYEITMLKLKGATLGKMALGLRVRRVDYDGPLSWGTAAGRWAVVDLPNRLSCSVWYLLDSLWCLWDPARQCLHDKVVKTIVITTR